MENHPVPSDLPATARPMLPPGGRVIANALPAANAASPHFVRPFLRAGRALSTPALAGVAAYRLGHAGADDTIRVALIGCGGRGTGAAANALASRQGPVRLVAMADVFPERLARSHETLKQAATRTEGSADSWIRGFQGEQVDVPPERRFIGFEAYRQAMECLRPGDVAILTTPVAFRWVHFAHAISRGLNVFMEKPITVDGPTTRRMLALGEESVRKNLKVGVGLMCRHCAAREELYARLRDGAIGDLLTLRSYRLVAPAGFTGPRPADLSELMYQIQRYLGFFWASGGVFHDFVAHNVDECCWMKDAWPVSAQGSGGRHYREGEVDQNLDLYSVEYVFADGARLYLKSRYMPRCREEFASYIHGTRGSAVISTFMHTPAKCRIFRGQAMNRADMTWAFPQPEPNPYELEWDHLLEAIRKDRPYNEVKRGAEASLVVLMGRRAVHTGQVVTFEDMLADTHEFAPGVDRLTPDSPAPVLLGAATRYPGPQPGRLRDREF